jgi:hypothetical protein
MSNIVKSNLIEMKSGRLNCDLPVPKAEEPALESPDTE